MGKGLPRSSARRVTPASRGDLGSPAGTGVTAKEPREAGGKLRHVVIALKDTPVVMADNAGVVAFGSLKIFDFPEGDINFLGATADLVVTKSSAGVNADWDGDFSIGSVAANNGATLATTEQDMIPTTATPQAVAGATTAKGKSTSTEGAKIFDGTATALDAYLNVLVDDADHDVTGTPCNLIFNGKITLTYLQLGDI